VIISGEENIFTTEKDKIKHRVKFSLKICANLPTAGRSVVKKEFSTTEKDRINADLIFQ
jgi:hypothetical protein